MEGTQSWKGLMMLILEQSNLPGDNRNYKGYTIQKTSEHTTIALKQIYIYKRLMWDKNLNQLM